MVYPLKYSIKELNRITRNARLKIVEMIHESGSGHPGGSLSAIDLLIVLYFNIMKHDPKIPKWKKRDRFVLSKGHCCPALYTVLALTGYFQKEELLTFRKMGSRLQGHPHMLKLPGIEISTGSLGQGLSVANGMALSFKMDKKPNRVFCMVGDGELDEGQIWEGVSTAGHYKLDNVIMIVDNNNLQIDGKVDEVKMKNPIDRRLESFGWQTVTLNGHDLKEIESGFKRGLKCKNRPFAIIAKTVKGKGVSFMENKAGWHGRSPDEDEYRQALQELGED